MGRSKELQAYMNAVANLGCLICGEPAELHHPRIAAGGMGLRANSWLVVPLCPRHHNSGAFGECVHNGYETFRRNHMDEAEMLARVIQQMMTKI